MVRRLRRGDEQRPRHHLDRPLQAWLAKDEGDKKIDVTKDVTLEPVLLAKEGLLCQYYIGYEMRPYGNATGSPREQKDTFEYEYARTVTIARSVVTSLQTKASLGFEWLGAKCGLEGASNQAVTNSNSTATSEKLRATSSFAITIPPHAQRTVIAMRFAIVMETPATSSGLGFTVADRQYEIVTTFEYEGILSKAQAEEEVHKVLMQIAGSAGTTMPLQKHTSGVGSSEIHKAAAALNHDWKSKLGKVSHARVLNPDAEWKLP